MKGMALREYERGWVGGLPETPCGYGSLISQTRQQREWLADIAERYQIKTIADIGAGDLNWIPLVNWPHQVTYSAYDLVPRNSGVKKFDILQQVPKKFDCILCLWVLNHMSEAQALKAIENIRASGSVYMVLTYWPAMPKSLDIEPLESVVIRPRINADIRLCKC